MTVSFRKSAECPTDPAAAIHFIGTIDLDPIEINGIPIRESEPRHEDEAIVWDLGYGSQKYRIIVPMESIVGQPSSLVRRKLQDQRYIAKDHLLYGIKQSAKKIFPEHTEYKDDECPATSTKTPTDGSSSE